MKFCCTKHYQNPKPTNSFDSNGILIPYAPDTFWWMWELVITGWSQLVVGPYYKDSNYFTLRVEKYLLRNSIKFVDPNQ